MLHLLPVRLIVWAIVALAMVVVAAALYSGWAGGADSISLGAAIIRWSSSIVTAGAVVVLVAWRWIPPVQRSIFPYLGGAWSGRVCFKREDGTADERNVSLLVKHNLLRVVMLLESIESTSKTMVVHADKDPHFDRYSLYYTYRNERKLGMSGDISAYRGLAIMGIELGSELSMHGDYFTDSHRRGTLHLDRTAPNPWWMLWR